MSTNPETEQINQLITEKRYEEAKAILRKSSDVVLLNWLDRLEVQFPTPGKRYIPKPSSNYRPTAEYQRGGCLTAFLLFIGGINILAALVAFSPLQLIFSGFVVICVSVSGIDSRGAILV